jgi:hypothetical protein
MLTLAIDLDVEASLSSAGFARKPPQVTEVSGQLKHFSGKSQSD